MATPAEVASRIAEWRRRDDREHPQGLYELVLAWLDDTDDEVRLEAVLFLGRHLKQLSDGQRLLEVAVADSSDRIRKAACDALGGAFRNTHDRRLATVLADISRNTAEDGDVRAAALAAIRRINGQRL
jgi:HEAT repeat protein